ncbi:relaxase/mobilization nuclease domain-containing protein [Arcobacter cloacae]|uniref:MobA/VirD2-like nuclease domain-containing protein n=1 Tax=Arcobacter cloacae TaxID=1054034 RepID=A0A4Q0ZJ48_9BACT|nr:relaxase/mobilization nuclease domain-containing protein [Arcobacter cloacae]RXJ83576.1 hypothetical protein CRU90_09305 [Arcobacter cloacae]
MNDLLKELKIEELLQKELKKVKKDKKKKSNIFLNLQSNNESNFANSGNSDFRLKIKDTTNNYINNNTRNTRTFKINSNNSEIINPNFTSSNSITKNHSASISHFSNSRKIIGLRNDFTHKKSGVVVNRQSIVLKTNFEMSGRMNKKGLRPTSKQIGTHASSSLNYMNNHGSKDLEKEVELSNIYDKNGDLILKEELEQIKKDLSNGVQGFRRTMVDVGQKDFSRDDLNKLVRDSMQSLMEKTGKNFEYNFAMHTNTDHIHAHILSYGKNSDINLTKEQLQIFKEIIGSKTNEILLDMQNELKRDEVLELKNEKEIVKNLDNKNDLYL